MPTFYTSASDGRVRANGRTFKVARKKEVADTKLDTYIYYGVGVYQLVGFYYVTRGFMYFDTSSLGEDAEIISATLRFHAYSITRDFEDFVIHVQSGMPINPHKPMELADYNMLHYSGDGGNVSSVGKVAGEWWEIILNAQGIGWINKTGWTKFCLRTHHDIDNIAPDKDTSAIIQISTYERGVPAELVVTLEAPLPIVTGHEQTIPIRYIKPTVLIKRNGKIIGYRTSYTPYGIERPIQPEVV